MPVRLLPDELFSSWIVRAALKQGCDPLVLTGEMWGKWRILTIDADRINDETVFRSIACVSGNTIEGFKQNSLYSTASKILGGNPPEKAIWPWILALGSRNTKRNGGVQYCPLCLAEDVKPYFRRYWRFAWHTVCEKHQVSLLDRCHACHSPLEPHRLSAEDRYVHTCATCKADLSQAPIQSVSAEMLAYQRQTDKIITLGEGVFQQQKVSTVEWFKLSDFFISMLRRSNRNQTLVLQDFLNQIAKPLPKNFPVQTGAGIEMLQTKERQILLSHLYPLMSASKEEFENAAIETNLTRQAFCSKDDVLPETLKHVYDTLPDNAKTRTKRVKRSPCQPRPRHEVMRMMARLERKLEMAQR